MGIGDAEPLAGGGQDCTILDLDSVSHSIAGVWESAEFWISTQKSPHNK